MVRIVRPSYRLIVQLRAVAIDVVAIDVAQFVGMNANGIDVLSSVARVDAQYHVLALSRQRECELLPSFSRREAATVDEVSSLRAVVRGEYLYLAIAFARQTIACHKAEGKWSSVFLTHGDNQFSLVLSSSAERLVALNGIVGRHLKETVFVRPTHL